MAPAALHSTRWSLARASAAVSTSHPAVELLPTPPGEQELPTPWKLLHPAGGPPTPHGEQEHLMPALAENLAFASNPSWGTRTHSSRSSWVSTAAFQPLMGNKNPRIDPQADRITHDAGRPGEQRGRHFGCSVFQPLMGNTKIGRAQV